MRQRNNFAVPKLISVIIPAYKQEKTIHENIKDVEKALQEVAPKYEIIIVIDGMYDKTEEQAKKTRSPHIKVLSYEKNHGKGYAVRYGMLKAKGDIIGFIDAGMDINPAGFAMLLNHMEWYNADIIVGSKLHPASKVNYPITRKILSRGYRGLTRVLFGFKVRDTQVGLKFFKKQVVQDVLPLLLVKRFAFDVELLAVSYSMGFKRIYEAPVEITFSNNSTIGNNSFSIFQKNFWKTIYFMVMDTLAVFYRLKILHYYQNKKQDEKLAKSKSYQVT